MTTIMFIIMFFVYILYSLTIIKAINWIIYLLQKHLTMQF